jgi:hypothetical protein
MELKQHVLVYTPKGSLSQASLLLLLLLLLLYEISGSHCSEYEIDGLSVLSLTTC